MAKKKKISILKELEKYNEELSNHINKVEFDKIYELAEELSSKKTDNEDFRAILASNIVDLRTELSLLRRNLSNEIEAVVLKQVRETNEVFFKQVNNFTSMIISDVKENLGKFVSELNNNVLEIKKEFIKVREESSNFEDKFRDLNNCILDLKSVVEGLETDFNTHNLEIKRQIEELRAQNISNFARIKEKINAELSLTKEIQRNILSRRKNNGLLKMPRLNKKGINEGLVEEKSQVETEINLEKVAFNDVENKSFGFDVDNNINLLDEIEPVKEKKVEVGSKILDIDRRIKTLESLK